MIQDVYTAPRMPLTSAVVTRKPPTTTIVALRFPRELFARFVVLARAELGPRPSASGDAAVRMVIERLIEAYVREREYMTAHPAEFPAEGP